MVAEPIGAVDSLRAVDPDHEVPICQHLQPRGWGREWRELTRSGSASPLIGGNSSLLTFLTVATHIAERLRGSMASNFIPSLNQSPFWSTSLTWWCTHGER